MRFDLAAIAESQTQLWDSDVSLNPLHICLMTMSTMSLFWRWLASSEHTFGSTSLVPIIT